MKFCFHEKSETIIVRQLSNDYIIKYYDYFYENLWRIIVTEYCEV